MSGAGLLRLIVIQDMTEGCSKGANLNLTITNFFALYPMAIIHILEQWDI